MKTDEPNPMKGVKTKTRLSYEYDFGDGKEFLDSKTISKYNSDGNMIEESSYKSDGSLSSKFIFKYDSNGNEIESSCYESDGSLDSKTIFKYNSDGNMIGSSRYESDGSLSSKEIYKFDSNGKKVEVLIYNSDGEVVLTYISKYFDGKLSESTIYDSDGEVYQNTTYNYDSNGNEVESTIYYSGGDIGDSSSVITKKRYDSNGIMIGSSSSKDYGELLDTNFYKYDSKNRIIELIVYTGSYNLLVNPRTKITYEYEEY
jgi:hypothetical protein